MSTTTDSLGVGTTIQNAVTGSLRISFSISCQFSVAGYPLNKGELSIFSQGNGACRGVVLKFEGIKPQGAANFVVCLEAIAVEVENALGRLRYQDPENLFRATT
jgi:hypothetical protein